MQNKFTKNIGCKLVLVALTGSFLLSCTEEKDPNVFEFKINNLTDEAYPDNPDLGFMSESYDHHFLETGSILRHGANSFSFHFFKKAASKPVVAIDSIAVMEFMPSIPNHLKDDRYLSHLAVINQEWNRNQIRFEKGEFTSSDPKITRVDLARNCLNSYLWELIVYTEESGVRKPYAHGWFTFPKALYAELFKQRNGVDFEAFAPVLTQYVVPESKEVNKNVLRKVVDTLTVETSDLSDTMYPLKGARLSKRKEIIYPSDFTTMRDLQTDHTRLATFLPPGFYSKSDPRTTELGRIREVESVHLLETNHSFAEGKTNELDVLFSDSTGRKTHFVVGGIDFETLPKLPALDAHLGWKSSMGFSNHTFYETYQEHEACSSQSSPYYAYLSDGEGKWLDSHELGIDGPILYWDAHIPNRLHLWLLSFERHALVGHYQIDIQ